VAAVRGVLLRDGARPPARSAPLSAPEFVKKLRRTDTKVILKT
jgi:hypothetical protein